MKVEDAQLILDGFLRDSHGGVGGRNGVGGKPSGFVSSVGNSVGVGGSGIGGTSPGGAKGESGGKGVESKHQHGGKVRRIEAGRRNGGIGADSSVETVGTQDIAGEGVGGVVVTEERIQERDGGLRKAAGMVEGRTHRWSSEECWDLQERALSTLTDHAVHILAS